jgi:CubicO group peptidase (beta-lactamase class C family)
MWISLLAAGLSTAAASPPGAEAVEAALRAQMAEANAPGAAFAIVRDGEVIAARGLGVRARGSSEAVTADTVFMIGSVTKTLTAAAVLRSAEARAFDLDEPVGRVLPGLAPAIAALTPRQLVSQTSGLGDLPGEAGAADEDALLRFVRSLGPKQFVAPAGAAFSYSNPGLALAGAVLEATRKESYADAMRALLFAPLGMTRTTLRPAEAAKHPRAAGHDAAGAPVAGYELDTRLGPAGYASSTAEDLASFMRDWLAAHEGHGRVLSPSTAKLMATKAADFPPTFDGTGYAHGLFVDDRRGALVLHHGGQTAGFSAEIVLVPERRLGLALLMNRSGVRFTKTIDAALQSLAGLPPVPAASLPKGEPVAEREARPLVGRYLNRWPLELLWSEGALRLRWAGSVRELRRLGPDRYAAQGEGPPLELRVGRGGDGMPYLRQFIWAFGRDFIPAEAVSR